MRVEISPAADAKIRDIQAGFREVSKDLTRRFAQEMRRVARQLSRYPRSGTRVDGLRRIVLRRFPYVILYQIDGGVVRVTSILHQKQDAQYWVDEDDRRRK